MSPGSCDRCGASYLERSAMRCVPFGWYAGLLMAAPFLVIFVLQAGWPGLLFLLLPWVLEPSGPVVRSYHGRRSS